MTAAKDDRARHGPVDRVTIAKILLGFAVAGLLVYLLGVAIGWERTLRRLETARLGWVLAAFVASALSLAAWAKSWQLVLAAGGTRVSYRQIVVTFYAATFANYVTPFGQAGGEPFVAYVLSQDTDASYEESLASVVTADLLKLLPFLNAAVLGIGYLIARWGLTETTDHFAIALASLTVGMPAVVVACWHYRAAVRRTILRGLDPLTRRVPGVSVEDARARIDRLYGSIERIAASPRHLVAAAGYAYVGWICFALPLYFTGLALDLPIPALLVCFVVPATVVAGLVPTPGGLAAIEGTVVGLLSALTAMSAADALAVATVYRLAVYWFVLAAGGIAALWVIRRV